MGWRSINVIATNVEVKNSVVNAANLENIED